MSNKTTENTEQAFYLNAENILEWWEFDLKNTISEDDMEKAQAQLLLYAVKDDIDVDCYEVRRELSRMRNAVAAHNWDIRKSKRQTGD